VNKSLIKFLTDFGPLVIFFYFYYNSGKDLQVAIPPLIVATIISILIVWFFEKKIPMVPLAGGILITLFGGLTIYFNNPIFIYMKPTIINILFGLSLFFGKYFTKEPLLKLILGKSLPLNDEGWKFTCENFNINIDNGLYFGNKNFYTENQNIFISGISKNQIENIRWKLEKIS